MGTLKQQLYQEVANRSLGRLRDEHRKKHTPKKDGRFMIDGITYEIGVARALTDGVSFDISSKVPIESLPLKSSKDKYFRLIKNLVNKDKNPPESVDMDNILTSPQAQEIKERDYLKLLYKYSDSDLYNEKSIQKEMDLIRKSKKSVPRVPGINSVSGRLILLAIEDAIYKKSSHNLMVLIKSNGEVLKQYRKKK